MGLAENNKTKNTGKSVASILSVLKSFAPLAASGKTAAATATLITDGTFTIEPTGPLQTPYNDVACFPSTLIITKLSAANVKGNASELSVTGSAVE